MKKILTSLTITFLSQAVMIAQTEEATIKENNDVKDSLIKMTENSTPAILKQDSTYTETIGGNNVFETSSFGELPASGMGGNYLNLTDTKAKTNDPVVYGEKFCDVTLTDGKIFLKNFKSKGLTFDFELDNTILKPNDMSNQQIIFMKDKKAIYIIGDHGISYIQFSDSGTKPAAESNSYQIPENVSPKFVKGQAEEFIVITTEKHLLVCEVGKWPTKLFDHDGSEFFTHEGAVYEDVAKGIIVATTPTTLFVNTPETNGQWNINYKEIGLVEMKKPYIKRGNNADLIEVRDEKLKTPDGKPVVFEVDLKENNMQVFLDD